ncbi:MAG TPA: FAD-binding oxidoreductase [Burkholderiaceae bacterium]|nr:FAD-binding oxidoreductase [Burkholderiaceae bacterium]
MDDELRAHRQRRDALLAQLRAQAAGAPLGLAKGTSNLFRDRAEAAKHRLDLSAFHHVLAVDRQNGWVDAEGLVTFEALADATLAHGAMPAVVPQLKTITLGGAAAGIGIEATSFRHGLVHHGLLELDVLLPDGEVVNATPHNGHSDLFFGFPNSYGTLGYALRLRQRTLPVRPFVRVEHRRHDDAAALFAAMAAACDGDADFVDAVAFGARPLVLNLARFVDEAPHVSDYTYEHIYYRSLLDTEVDHLHTREYLWRWDTDWFWCSKNVGAQNPLLRRLFGRERLNSRTYTRIMRWNARTGLARRWARLRGDHPEAVIQDVDIPLQHAAGFLEFLLREIGIVPIWLCPLRAPAGAGTFPLYPLAEGAFYVNFGFWDTVHSRTAHEAGHFNRLVEREVLRLGGIKSLYSDSFFTRQEFDAAYGMAEFARLKARYDPHGRLLGLYEKCVQRA